MFQEIYTFIYKKTAEVQNVEETKVPRKIVMYLHIKYYMSKFEIRYQVTGVKYWAIVGRNCLITAEYARPHALKKTHKYQNKIKLSQYVLVCFKFDHQNIL